MTENQSGDDGGLAASAEKLRQELDRWLGVAWNQGERALDAVGLRSSGTCWAPVFDLVETPEDVRVVIDLPGVDRHAIDITLAGNMLTIRGEKPSTPIEEGHVSHVGRRASGSFSHSIPMPVAVNADEVSAEVCDGVLTVMLAKSERAKPRQISIKEHGAL